MKSRSSQAVSLLSLSHTVVRPQALLARARASLPWAVWGPSARRFAFSCSSERRCRRAGVVDVGGAMGGGEVGTGRKGEAPVFH